MAYLLNDAEAFADEFLSGLAAAQPGRVRQVDGGVVRAQQPEPGRVAVVIGGGSGHYPAFAGLVGAGLAHGAAVGNLFASPSTQQIVSVVRAAEAGGGVLLTYGNYAGDVLNFTAAQVRLAEEGIVCTNVPVTDDVSSAPPADVAKRRGIAGDLIVFKVAGAAADAGASLDEVTAIARRANDRTRSFGVAFTGCTLPGAAEPLFTVPLGRMGVGMGIHGEPGIAEADVPTADGLAQLLVDKVLADRPAAAAGWDRVAVLLNGLGGVKYEELYVTFRKVAKLLRDAGLELVDPEVGELVTSFEMAGVSLTVAWLDDELERLWRADADAPAFRKHATSPDKPAYAWTATPLEGQTPSGGAARDHRQQRSGADGAARTGSPSSVAAVPVLLAGLDALREVIELHVDELGRLDAVAGDGDHGIGMKRGADAACQAAHEAAAGTAGIGTVLRCAGGAWADRAGGTSGAIWGLLLRTVGAELGDEEPPQPSRIAAAVESATDAVARFGGAQLGDKTLLDALVPFGRALRAAADRGASLVEGWSDAGAAAASAAAATANLRPRIGRARPLAERSVGSPDPGAVSFALAVRAAGGVLVAQGAVLEAGGSS